jgi:predicted nuclease of restriction endonuclease-like (RecB) superfamily
MIDDAYTNFVNVSNKILQYEDGTINLQSLGRNFFKMRFSSNEQTISSQNQHLVEPSSTPTLIREVKTLIHDAKQSVAVTVNATLSMLYWQIGHRINAEILHGDRAEYGKQVILLLSKSLTEEFGDGWGSSQLRTCMQFATAFPDIQIVHTLCVQLSWSHLRSVIPIDDPIKRDFYIEMCKLEKWSVRLFREKIQSMLYERTALSKKPVETIQKELELLKSKQQISPDLVFKDPYFLTFLELKDHYSEKDLESSILAELQQFLTELGTDFAFLARQKRITIDNRDYKIDLLFFHRRLKSLVAIDLKLGEFEAAYKGQMELYLRYLEKYEVIEGENAPIGLILCTGKNEEHVELMQLDKSNIRVAEYLTVLPSAEVLKAKLQKALWIAQNRISKKNDNDWDENKH